MHSQIKSHSFFLVKLLLVLWTLSSCSLVKWVPKNQLLLMENELFVDNKKAGSEMRSIIRQQPNERLLGGPRLSLQLYNLGDPNAKKGLKKFWINMGKPPVTIDSALVNTSAQQLGAYLFNKGYFENESHWEINVNGNKRAKVRYELYRGPRYYIDSVSFEINSPEIERWATQFMATSLLYEGMPYDAQIIDKERERIASFLREKGFFAFPVEGIRYIADTTGSNKSVELLMRIDDRIIESKDSIYTRPFLPFKINRVFIDPNYSIAKENEAIIDTQQFDVYDYVYREEEIFLRQRVPAEALHFNPGDIYQQSKIKESYRHLLGLKIFQSTEIAFRPDPIDTTKQGLIAEIRLKPLIPNNFTTELTGTNTSGNFGIEGSFGWINRNLFKGGEIFNIRLKGSVAAQYNSRYGDQLFNTREAGIETSLEFPKFLLPVNTFGLLPKRMNPRSGVAFDILWQERQEFSRVLFNVRLYYDWTESISKHHTLTLMDWRYTNVLNLDPDFAADLQFKTGFESVVSIGSRYTFNYNGKVGTQKKNFTLFTVNAETAGNLAGRLISKPAESDSTANTVFGVQATQYARLDFDFRYYIELPSKQYLVFRAFTGALFGYGNGSYILPFEKSFFAGGTNDIRAWPAYRLGPGSFEDGDDLINIAPFKLVGNVEYRFDIFKALKGAVFVDFGNIWIIQRDLPVYKEYILTPETYFEFDRFLEEIAVGTGFGVRYDLSFFVVRLDLGYPIVSPYLPEGKSSRLFFRPFNFSEFTYNLAIGYPF